MLNLRPALVGLAVLGGVAAAPVPPDAPSLPRALAAATSEAQDLGPEIRLAQSDADPSRAASLEIRLSRIEEELRRLTGRLEELEFGQQRSDARLDKLVSDLDARLGRIEGGAPASSAATQPSLAAPEPEAETEPPMPVVRRGALPAEPARRLGDPLPDEDQAARQGYVLGTLPRDAIMGSGGAAEPDRQAALPATRDVPNTPKGRYDAAMTLLQSGDFETARSRFASFVEDYPSDALTPSAAYWLAETHYVTRDYQTAAALFARNYQTYGPEATKAPDNLLKMAMSLAQLGQTEQACQTFGELDRRHPNAPAPIKQAALRGKAQAGCS